jgi:hypothetical protein
MMHLCHNPQKSRLGALTRHYNYQDRNKQAQSLELIPALRQNSACTPAGECQPHQLQACRDERACLLINAPKAAAANLNTTHTTDAVQSCCQCLQGAGRVTPSILVWANMKAT